MTLKTKLAVAALALSLAGCATVASAPSGDYAVGTAYRVTLGRQWSDVSSVMPGRPAAVRLLSIDGPLLNRLYLTDGLGPGDFLVKPVSRERRTPTYRAGMSAAERVEFVADSVTALDYQRVETANLRPAAFLGSQGVRFDLTAKTREGLDMDGTAELAEVGGRLYVMLYLAPHEHFFAASLAEVESVFASVRKSA